MESARSEQRTDVSYGEDAATKLPRTPLETGGLQEGVLTRNDYAPYAKKVGKPREGRSLVTLRVIRGTCAHLSTFEPLRWNQDDGVLACLLNAGINPGANFPRDAGHSYHMCMRSCCACHRHIFRFSGCNSMFLHVTQRLQLDTQVTSGIPVVLLGAYGHVCAGQLGLLEQHKNARRAYDFAQYQFTIED